jgi:hypothetical protein
VEISITVDGGEPVDIHNPRFELLSPQRTVDLPKKLPGRSSGPRELRRARLGRVREEAPAG